jgi:hypothetical protein
MASQSASIPLLFPDLDSTSIELGKYRSYTSIELLAHKYRH